MTVMKVGLYNYVSDNADKANVRFLVKPDIHTQTRQDIRSFLKKKGR